MSCIIIGSGASAAVPMIGCDCMVCQSKDSKNHRLRPSIFLQIEGQNILIDAGPDFYHQALKYGINHLDHVLITHTHYDHIAGIDELRSYTLCSKKPIHCHLSKASHKQLMVRYPYFFKKDLHASFPAQFEFHLFKEDFTIHMVDGLAFQTLSYEHANMQVTGFRYKNLAYIPDIRRYSQDIFSYLQGVEILILGALREEPSKMHFGFKEAISFSQKIPAKVTYLTHLNHEVDYHTSNQKLPQGVQLAYDGLSLEL